MAQDTGLLFMALALCSLFALNLLTVKLMLRRNHRFLKIIQAMHASPEAGLHQS